MAETDRDAATEPYDALLLVSFGGPERTEDVVPFLENVTRGRGIPRERLEEVGKHYFERGGRSPINDQCRALITAIEADLRAHGLEVPVYWGNRNWDPFLTDTMAAMERDGVRRAACFVTSAYSSYSGCRQYRENLYDAVTAVGPAAPRLDRLRHYFNHPGFVDPFVDRVIEAVQHLGGGARLVFVTHSIPTAMNDASGLTPGGSGGAYVAQHLDVARTIARRVGEAIAADQRWDLTYCSRSGSPSVPWLEPDVNDHLKRLADEGEHAAVVVPIGFVSDHMEVVHDLDTEAAATAGEAGLAFARVPTPGTDPRFVAMVRDLLTERAAADRGEQATRTSIGALEPSWDRCPPGCCAGRTDRPALCGQDPAPVATEARW